jgi:hypothetical protein
MPAAQDGLMLFTRYPQPGQTKTRLIPYLGQHGAATLQRHMTEYLFEQMQGLRQHAVQTEVHFSGGSFAQMQRWLGSQGLYRPQGSGGLGQKLIAAFQQGFQAGLRRIVIIGSDCPSIEPQQILHALQRLQHHDVVIGPATDGGYYLIGLRQVMPELFQDIAWGTDTVFQQTVAAAQQLQRTVSYLEPLTDIDRPEDLPIWQNICQNAVLQNEFVS